MKNETKIIIKTFLTELVGGLTIVAIMLGLALLFGSCSHNVAGEPWWDSILGALIGAAFFVLFLRFIEKKIL